MKLACMNKCGKSRGDPSEYDIQQGGRVIVCNSCADTMRNPAAKQKAKNEMLYGTHRPRPKKTPRCEDCGSHMLPQYPPLKGWHCRACMG